MFVSIVSLGCMRLIDVTSLSDGQVALGMVGEDETDQ